MKLPRSILVALTVVLLAAAVLSFDALRGLALAVAIPPALAWLLPIVVDAGAAASCAVWLGGRAGEDAARFAGRMTWALLAVTVAGNAGQLGMHAHGITPPWWVAVAVGAIAPAVVGSTVHLVVLLVRRPAEDPVRTTAPDRVEVESPAPVQAVAEVLVEEEPAVEPSPRHAVTTVDRHEDEDEDLVDRARQLVADGAGRPTLRRELGITDYRAKALLAQLQEEAA